MIPEFAPRVVGLLCSWCSYAGADGAGAAHLALPDCFSPIRVMCTGRVDMSWILRALAAGTDGILVCGCHPGDCHYVDGNAKALGRVELLRGLLDQWRIERERVRIEWVSSSESVRFAQVVNEFVDQIRQMGPIRVTDASAEASLLASNHGGLP